MNRTDFNDDEFDIELLAQKVSRILGKVIFKLLFPLRVIVSKPIRLISFMLAGVLVAVTLRYTLPPVYKSSFVMKPTNKGDLYFYNLLMDIDNLINDRDYEAAAKYLKLDEKICSKIVAVNAELIRKNPLNDSADATIIYIATSDRTLFDTIQISLMNYLETTEYYNKVRILRERDIEDMRTKLAEDINQIEELKKSLNTSAQPRSAGGFVYGEPVNPVIVYEEALKLYNQQMQLKWRTTFINNFELVKKCVSSKKPASPRLAKLLVLCIGISVILCFLYNYRKL